MRRRRAAGAGAVAFWCLLFAATAAAATPVRGGRYEGKTVALTIAQDGRRLSRQGSRWVALASGIRYPACGRRGPAPELVLADRTAAAPLMIDRGGHIRLDKTWRASGISRRVTISGEFQSARLAVGFLRVRTTTPQRHCDTGRIAFTTRFTGERFVPFGACAQPGSRVLARSGEDALYSEPFRDGGYHWDWFSGVLRRVVVLCRGTSGARSVVDAAAADPDPGYDDGDLVTKHWVLNDLYWGAYYDSCCENGYSEVAIQRRSDGRTVNWVSCDSGDHNPCEQGDLWYLSPGGALCWTDHSETKPSVTEVVVYGAAGTPNDAARGVLDTGVVRSSLKLQSSTLSWLKDDGTYRTAQVD